MRVLRKNVTLPTRKRLMLINHSLLLTKSARSKLPMRHRALLFVSVCVKIKNTVGNVVMKINETLSLDARSIIHT